jgi:hypothetical protein
VSDPVEPISPGQFYWTMVVGVVAAGIYLWPQYVISQVGSDSIVSTVASIGVYLGILFVQSRLLKRTGAPTLTGVFKVAWGSLGAFVWMVLSIVMVLSVDSVLLALYGDLLKTFFYSMTPRVVMTGSIVVVGCWLAMRSLSVVVRNVQFWTPISVAGVVLLVVLAIPNAREWGALRPAWPFDWGSMAYAGMGTWFIFANGSVVVGLLNHVSWAKKPRAGLLVLLGGMTQGIVVLAFLVLVIANLGTAPAVELTWPIVYVFELITLRSFFIAGAGAFVMLAWSIMMVLITAIHLSLVSENVEFLAGGPRRLLVWLWGAILLAGTVSIGTIVDAKVLLFDWLNPIYLGFVVFLVGSTYVLILIRGTGRSRSG